MQLIEKILSAQNLTQAANEVIRNKGAAGIDGMSVKELKDYLKDNREILKTQILKGEYIPQAIRGKEQSAAISRTPLKIKFM